MIFAGLLAGTIHAHAQVEIPLELDHVILISVDGMRADTAVAIDAEQVPTLQRLLAASATLNARTIESWTRTLPNHVSMVTSRPEAGPLGHDWESNDTPASDVTLHTNHGSYLASVFDVAHDNGLYTSLYSGKTKFILFSQSYDDSTGEDDVTGDDDGRDKIDSSTIVEGFDPDDLVDAFLAELASVEMGRSFFFLHFHDPDTAGHSYGWDLTPGSEYIDAVSGVDAAIGRILDAITADPVLLGRTAVIVTADHGGGSPLTGHGVTGEPLNYTIPLYVWLCDGQPTLDLYEINADSRTDPGSAQIDDAPAPDQPIRNADTGNLALSLLGLPAIPGSVHDAEQDLRVVLAEPTCGGSAQCTQNSDCESTDPCFDPLCDESGGCTTIANSASCDDGDLCTTGDFCDGAGGCAGTPLDCSEMGGACAVGECDAESGSCVSVALEDGTTCGDMAACTIGPQVCDAGLCVDAAACDDTCERCLDGGCASRCGFPVSNADAPVVSDAFFVLQAAVGGQTCAACVCDVDASGAITAPDALRLLRTVVGLDAAPDCSTGAAVGFR